MKKIMIVCAVVLAACFTSCEKDTQTEDPNVAACWQITVTYKDGGGEFLHMWGTASEIDALLAEIRQSVGDEAKSITKKKTSKSAGDCY